ncbi:MAG: hypothetical protein RLZZ297_1096, partial [Chloroflexota bacterium]
FDFGNGMYDANVWFGRTEGNDLTTELYSPGKHWSTCNACLIPGSQHVYALRIDGETADFYVDGVAVASNPYSAPADIVTRTQNYIGRSNWPDPYFLGSMQVFQLYDRPLSVGQIVSESLDIIGNVTATRTASRTPTATVRTSATVTKTASRTATSRPGTPSRSASPTKSSTRSPTKSPQPPKTPTKRTTPTRQVFPTMTRTKPKPATQTATRTRTRVR